MYIIKKRKKSKIKLQANRINYMITFLLHAYDISKINT